MSKKVHHKRSAGNHDLSLINNTIKIKKKKIQNCIEFDKSIDDRSKKNKWQKLKPPHIIFEGWCNIQKNRFLKNLLI